MAFRFMREGLYTRRKRLRSNGFTPFVDDLMWTATDWHYQHYIRRAARVSLLTHQEGNIAVLACISASEIGRIFEKFRIARASSLVRGADRPYLRIATPNIVPLRRQSNPFCRASSNYSGWQFQHKQLEKSPRPYRSRRLGGTDLSVPVMPKH
ncbi:hypothetical protein X943_001468 [Babesia divergens]|uniref:Uncharacterized protein n=1 Tax=Babesia divergens TaxID=32595 RepID=A0AAD9LK48_BABDI|nr:hypothetical protein X943_001468 [Babesia divergens]